MSGASFAANLSSHFLSVIQSYKDSDKKMSPARRFSGYHKSIDSRKNFGVSSENSSMTNSDLARYIRSHFDRNDKSRLFYDFLILPDSDLLDLVTFNVISDFSIIPATSGFTFSKLFQTEAGATMNVFEVFTKIDLLFEFICAIYGTHFKYLETIAKLIRESALAFLPRVVIHVFFLLVEALFVATPHASNEALSSALEVHALVWDCCIPLKSHFYTQCVTYTMRYTASTLAALEKNAPQQLSTAKDKKDPSSKPTLLTAARAQPSIKGVKDYSALQGFCVRYLRDGVCPRLNSNSGCQARGPINHATRLINLKHGPEFAKLTPSAKSNLRTAFQALEGVPCKV